MNNWLERYTYAVKSYLPAQVRGDVADELLSDLQDECDYRAETLNRDLTDDEIKALLKERGHPMLVAADFQPRPTLVSHSLFPVYLQLLRWLVMAIALVQICLAGLSLIQQQDPRVWQILPQLFWSTLNASLYGFAWLTLIFYLFGESINRTELFKHWKPDTLPKVSAEGEYISRTGSAIEVVVLVYFTAWLNRIIPRSLGENPIAFVFSEQWIGLLPWINALLLASLLMAVAKLIFPYWTRRKLIGDMALHLPTLIILAVIYQWDSALSVVIGTGEHAREFAFSSTWIGIGLAGYAIVALIDVITKARQYRAIG
ncbi:hypothetical protein [Gilvimarinus algae]|uniref:Uncharacterized protein n=1 Tax=Gilvimarinus algae TaxID=3058037 RepID=A0ABT8THF4_9GAMM|nr:hypothetical protein [Gilvimarinus sp. SDUM040014]MDO3383346.1 hypothetical protein [Gilvimarinus sp. SDUM040014]